MSELPQTPEFDPEPASVPPDKDPEGCPQHGGRLVRVADKGEGGMWQVFECGCEVPL